MKTNKSMAVRIQCITGHCTKSPLAQAQSVVCDCRIVKSICLHAYIAEVLKLLEIRKLSSPPCVRWTIDNCFCNTCSRDKTFSTSPITSSSTVIRAGGAARGGPRFPTPCLILSVAAGYVAEAVAIRSAPCR